MILENAQWQEASRILCGKVRVCGTERILLQESCGRILAEDLTAAEDVPAFDRSPYDGYAFRAQDSFGASGDIPVTLSVIEEIPAGSVPEKKITKGTAAKILTGAPIPKGADTVIMFEKTRFTASSVTLFSEVRPGDNLVLAGEDVKKGQILAKAGSCIDPGLAGTLAGQGKAEPLVYRIPKVGIISTGSELIDEISEAPLPQGKIRNTNRYTLAAALRKDGCEPVWLGTAGDDAGKIAALITEGVEHLDLVILTGGVSVGDYDLTPEAMDLAGCSLLVKGVSIKPGMACCYGECRGRLVIGLSGNPSSSLINYYAAVRPAVRKLTGRADYQPAMIRVILKDGFRKKSKSVRLLKGTLAIEDGRAVMHLPAGQGNVMIGSSIGCDLIAVVPAGSGPLEEGCELEGFMV
ncbi:MAG: molybdopterin molybdotransferase MoeA [Parasporobacterium sp.]|nr:molybdopterin molybdotransferase MoeA [Parasporobacterium sp.]